MLPNPDFDERNKRLHNYQNTNLIWSKIPETINLEPSRIYSELRWRNFSSHPDLEFQYIRYNFSVNHTLKWSSNGPRVQNFRISFLGQESEDSSLICEDKIYILNHPINRISLVQIERSNGDHMNDQIVSKWTVFV